SFGGFGRLAGRLISFGVRRVVLAPLIVGLVSCAFMVVGMVAVVPSIHSWFALALALAVWGITQAALFLVSHVRLIKAAPQAPAFAASLNIAGANLGIGIGAVIGGRVIDHLGLGRLGFAAAGIIFLAILLAWVLMKSKPTPVAA
ncbi:MFS transporter, partial [Pseudomonas viridiflava]|uniref:MFS transporter n=1 Tax=Pseudomonas viridiflava TaxID=33069 RepID=UPI001F12919F